jgi:hypothetical protein
VTDTPILLGEEQIDKFVELYALTDIVMQKSRVAEREVDTHEEVTQGSCGFGIDKVARETTRAGVAGGERETVVYIE